MTLYTDRGSGTPATTGTTWASATNAVDGTPPANPATYATYTNATASAVGTIEVTGYDFGTVIGASDTLTSISVSLRHFENTVARFASVAVTVWDGATQIGGSNNCTLATAARDDAFTYTPTLAQLRSATFKVRVTITGAASTQSRVESIDHVDVIATYTPLPAAITQASYRFYADGTESGSVALAAQDTSYTADVTTGDVNLLLRTRLQSTNAVAPAATDDWQLQYLRGDFYDISNYVVGLLLHSTQTQFAQSFIASGGPLTRATFYLYRAGTPTGTVSAALWAHDGGTFGGTGLPTGSALASSTTTVTASTLPTSPATMTAYAFDFDGTFTLTAGTQYFIGLVASGAAATPNQVLIAGDSTSPTHPGNPARLFSGTWSTQAANDMCFEVGTWTNITTGDTTAVAFNSANLTDGAATTNRLGAGSGSFVAGKVSEDGLVDDLGWTANNHTELLYTVTLKQAALANSDTLRFRVLRNGAITGFTYTQTPTINVTKTVAGGRPKVYLAGAFTKKPLKVRIGAAWVEKPVKVWTGSAWKALT